MTSFPDDVGSKNRHGESKRNNYRQNWPPDSASREHRNAFAEVVKRNECHDVQKDCDQQSAIPNFADGPDERD